MADIEKIAEEAEVIIDGYAIANYENGYRVVNLNAPEKVAVFSANSDVMETTMDDIELHIAQKHLQSAQKYMEA